MKASQAALLTQTTLGMSRAEHIVAIIYRDIEVAAKYGQYGCKVHCRSWAFRWWADPDTGEAIKLLRSAGYEASLDVNEGTIVISWKTKS